MPLHGWTIHHVRKRKHLEGEGLISKEGHLVWTPTYTLHASFDKAERQMESFCMNESFTMWASVSTSEERVWLQKRVTLLKLWGGHHMLHLRCWTSNEMPLHGWTIHHMRNYKHLGGGVDFKQGSSPLNFEAYITCLIWQSWTSNEKPLHEWTIHHEKESLCYLMDYA